MIRFVIVGLGLVLGIKWKVIQLLKEALKIKSTSDKMNNLIFIQLLQKLILSFNKLRVKVHKGVKK